MRRHLPHRGHRQGVDVPDLGKRDEVARGPIAGRQPLLVDPLRSIGVAAHLQVLGQLLLPDRPSLDEEDLDLAQNQGVALDGGRVVRLLVPDVAPDVLGFDRRRQSAEACAQFIRSLGQLPVDRVAAPSASRFARRHACRLQRTCVGHDPQIAPTHIVVRLSVVGSARAGPSGLVPRQNSNVRRRTRVERPRRWSLRPVSQLLARDRGGG